MKKGTKEDKFTPRSLWLTVNFTCEYLLYITPSPPKKLLFNFPYMCNMSILFLQLYHYVECIYEFNNSDITTSTY